MGAKPQKPKLEVVVGRLAKETRAVYLQTGQELSEEACGEKVREVLDVLWERYLAKRMADAFQIDVPPPPGDDPTDDGL